MVGEHQPDGHTMSLQEIEQAIAELPERQQAELRAWINQRAGASDVLAPTEPGGSGSWSPEATKPEAHATGDLEALAVAAGEHWHGGDGLEYQVRIRDEWDNRPSADR